MRIQQTARYSVLFLLLILGTTFALPAGTGTAWATDGDRWSLNSAIGLPDWFSITGEHRIRYETLNRQFRANSTGSDQILSLRTLVQAEWRVSESFRIKAELQDSRAELADHGSRMNNSIVNTAELLEAHISWRTKDLFAKGSTSELRGGRFTMDIGKRRFVGRNRFRNVIQGYTGVDWMWTSKEGKQIRAFFTFPVNPRPEDIPSLLDNEAVMDKETTDRIFWGVFYTHPLLPWETRGELFIFGLHEDDGPNFSTRNRQLYTPGFRIYRPAKKGEFDFELESVIQFGTSRATPAATDTLDLDHLAHFHHFEVGYTFKTDWSPRFFIEYDYASGDDDPNDGTHEGFDSLFGPNVQDFGPTSIHTAFARSNLSSPGARLEVRPCRNLFAYLSYRAFWLASATDTWAGASHLRDTTGNSESFLGHQLFFRVKWKALPNLKLEGGAAYRIDGEFQKTVPNSPHQGNTLYSYIQATFFF